MTEVSARDIEIVSKQLGRPARDVLFVAARCSCGNPVVVATRPRLEDGEPFPTFYYLTAPAATSRVSTLEASGLMPRLQQLLEDDGNILSAYQKAHQQYLADRESVLEVAELSGISAGGMPNRVKCLHALVAHSLAKGPGVNPIGDIALAECGWSPSRCECTE